jgi:hypothetical protein
VANSSIVFGNFGALTSSNASKGGAQAVDFNAMTGSNTLNNYAGGVIQARDADAVRPGCGHNHGQRRDQTNKMSIDPGARSAFSYAGSISNVSSVEVKSGTVTLSGANTYSGAQLGVYPLSVR